MIDLRPLKDVQFAHVFDGRLKKYGIEEVVTPNTTEGLRSLKGKDGWLLVCRTVDGYCCFEQRGLVPWSIYDAIALEFDTEVVSEYDHRYWGYATKEEYDAAMAELNRQCEDRFYENVLKYIRGEPHDLMPGTVGMLEAEIAKSVVERDPRLLAPEHRGALLSAVEDEYSHKHSVVIQLTEREVAIADMLVARTDELPRG